MAPYDISVIQTELHKLKKNELIDLITDDKLPKDFLNNDILKSVIENRNQKCINEVSVKNNKISDNNACENNMVEIYKNELLSELKQKNLILMDNINLLKENNNLLKEKLNTQEGKHQNKVNPKKKEPKNNNKNDVQLLENKIEPSKNLTTLFNNHQSREISINDSKIVECATTESMEGFTEVPSKRRHRNVIIRGTGPRTATLQTLEKRLWAYAGGFHPETTKEDMLGFLKQQFGNDNFEVEKLASQGTGASFRIGANFSLHDKIYDGNMWPENTKIKRFLFRRQYAKLAA